MSNDQTFPMLSKEAQQEIAAYEAEVAPFVTPDQLDDEMARFYPSVVGNGHPSVCLCSVCAPWENEWWTCPDCGRYVHDSDPHTDCEMGTQQNIPTDTAQIPDPGVTQEGTQGEQGEIDHPF